MLPLWIIDLREKSGRRDEFVNLLGQIDHVYLDEKNSISPLDEKQCKDTFATSIDLSIKSEETVLNRWADGSPNADMTLRDQLDTKEQKEAERNAKIVGNYWRYSQMANKYYGIEIRSNDSNSEQSDAAEIADKLYSFQSDLVEEGQKFIHELRASNVQPDLKINIIVLGDISEDFTRIVFPSIAGILQKEKGRMLPHHIHQGMEVIGMLYVPSNINTLDVDKRKSMQRTLNEIEVQHSISAIRGYDHMLLYQDVQNRTECTYPILSDKQLSEYLLQCIVHLYLACNESHPLLSGTASDDVFYFSMGASSVFFDTENEDMKGRHKFALEFIRNLKSQGINEKCNGQLHLLEKDEYNPESFIDAETINKLDCDIEEEIPSPHPLHNFLSKYLKRYYYNLYLRFYTKNLMQQIITTIENNTRDALNNIAIKSKQRFTDAKKQLFERLRDLFGMLSANDGGIPTVVNLFKEMQDELSQRRSYIQSMLEEKFWRKIESDYIPRKMEDKFMDYHDAYRSDIKNKTGGSNQLELKKQAVTELNGIISAEGTVLSRICRTVLLGIVSALAIVPVLDTLSPNVVDLGNVEQHSALWSVFLFCVPALVQLFMFWRYNRRKSRAVNNLKAIYLHDAFARIANRYESEINGFYDKMIALSDKYINRCEDIRKYAGVDFKEDEMGKPLFPPTLFNQPLVGGAFAGNKLLPEKESDDSEILINYIRYKLSELTNVDYFLFINQHKNLVIELFRDVAICENLIRRVNENGEEELVTKQQQEEELSKLWQEHLCNFHSQLKQIVKEALLPREDATVGEKLRHYCRSNPEHSDVLRSMIAYSATNGEITSSADMEFTDAKLNDPSVKDYIIPFVASASKQMQTDKYNTLYKKYIFITRWRCFEHLNLNRILPTEDFDIKIRRQRVYEEEIKHKNKVEEDNKPSIEEAKVQREHLKGEKYNARPSSLLLWALCPDDSSSEWFRLFDTEFFAEAYRDKNVYRRILNKND
jgi:hypothetical protein